MAQRRLLIIDISDNTVAGISAETRTHAFVPVAAGSSAYAGAEQLADAVRDVVRSCRGEGLCCHIALPASMLSFRSLSLPFTDRRKIDEALHYELADRLTFGDDDFLYDRVVVNKAGTGPTALLAAAVEKAALAPLLAAIGELGVKLEALGVSGMGFAVKMIESGYGAERAVVYLDAGSTDSTLFVCANGRVRAIRSLHGLGAARIDELGAEVRRTLLALDIGPGATIFLGGHTGSDPDAAQRFRARCEGADVVLVDMEGGDGTAEFPGDPMPRHVRTKLSAQLQAAPADERLFNLAPEHRGVRGRGALQLSRRALLAAVACLVALLAFGGYQVFDYNRLAQERAKLDGQIAAIFAQTLDGRQPHGDPLRELGAEITALEQSAAASIVRNPGITAVELLADLSARIPPSVRVGFDRFSFDRRRVQLDGVTDAYNDVDIIRRSLAQSPIYSSVSIDVARTGGDGRGVRFSLIATL